MLNFEIMYWAAFIGRKDIVEAMIKNGYSPIVISFKTIKSAVFGCVNGGQLSTLEMILSFEY